MTLAERLQHIPDNARVFIKYPNCEEIFDVKELKELADPFRDTAQDWMKSNDTLADLDRRGIVIPPDARGRLLDKRR